VLSQPALSSTVLSDDTSRDLGSWIADVLLPFPFVLFYCNLFSFSLRAQILHEFPHISYRLQLVGDRFDPSESEYLQVRTISGLLKRELRLTSWPCGVRVACGVAMQLQSVSTFAVPFACLGALLFVVGSAYAIYRCACTDPNAEYR
jgi:hypothetical protein